MSAASEITRRAKSNLAFALRVLPKARRDDAVVFYAYCRTVDDLADAESVPLAERRDALAAWRLGLVDGFAEPDAFQREVLALRDRCHLPNHLLTAIIDGCVMDLEPRRFATWDELSEYIWKVACAVGLVSIRLFGCTQPEAEPYAEALGRALQLTNILRDIDEDRGRGRIYLPQADLARHGYPESDLLARRYDPRLTACLEALADRAQGYFDEAAASLPAADRTALLPARIMAEIYQTLLQRMRADGFRVFDKRYRLSHARKLAILSKHLIA